VQATVLILDERADHLDTEAREALTEAINDFPGVAVPGSPDWHRVELVARRLWLVAGVEAVRSTATLRITPADGHAAAASHFQPGRGFATIA
jgi:ATPase subunit of ABC transporter with duplicated ATPase domains